MEITFKNLDNDYNKGQREFVGDIQPKFWYHGRSHGLGTVLVKRQSSQNVGKNKPKSKMFNHIGEYFGYLLAKQAGVKACPVDLVTLHDTKNKYSSTILLYTACASHSLRKPGVALVPGETIMDTFFNSEKEENRKIIEEIFEGKNFSRGGLVPQYLEDNVDLAIASLIGQTIDFERREGKRTTEEITQDAKDNVQDMVDMIVYDCIFGNYDRHSENWAVLMDSDSGKLTLYPSFDNEAVLGLRRTEAEISEIVSNPDTMQEKTDLALFSRMGIKGADSTVKYTEMLKYIVNKYPEYAIPSIEKITSRVDEKFVEELYDGVKGISTRGEDAEELTEKDELPEVYKIFGMEAFKNRREFALNLLREKQKQDDEKVHIME